MIAERQLTSDIDTDNDGPISDKSLNQYTKRKDDGGHRGHCLCRSDVDKQLIEKIRHVGHPSIHLLTSYNSGMNVIAEFMRLKITTDMLISLSDVDLQQIGVHCPTMRKLMLEDFKLMSKSEHSQLLKKNNNCGAESNRILLANVFKNLLYLKASLSAVLLHLYEHPTEKVLINNRRYTSKDVLATLDQISRELFEMELRLQEFALKKNQDTVIGQSRSHRRLNITGKRDKFSGCRDAFKAGTMWLAVLGSVTVVGVCLWRCYHEMKPPVVSGLQYSSYVRGYY